MTRTFPGQRLYLVAGAWYVSNKSCGRRRFPVLLARKMVHLTCIRASVCGDYHTMHNGEEIGLAQGRAWRAKELPTLPLTYLNICS